MLKNEKFETKKVCEYLTSLGIYCHAIPSVVFSKHGGGFPIGYRKGLPDLFIPRFRLYLEMKQAKPGKVKEHEENQERVHNILRNEGCLVYRCEGFEQAKMIIDELYERQTNNDESTI